MATIGKAKNFDNGRQLTAWLVLVPPAALEWRQADAARHQQRGDAYLRTLLIHGAHAVVRVAECQTGTDNWLKRLLVRRNNSGNLARQVRPQMAKPVPDLAPRVHLADKGAFRKFHQGPRRMPQSKVRMYGCNRYLLTIIECVLGKLGTTL
ncbi:MAG: transposase [Sulfuricaulis sp.]